MAEGRSGAGQSLSVAGTVISGVGTGFTGLVLSPAPTTVSSESGGLVTVENSGHVTRTGSFTVGKNNTSARALHGQNGTRKQLVSQINGVTRTFTAILTITRQWAARGLATYQVALSVDGDVAIT